MQVALPPPHPEHTLTPVTVVGLRVKITAEVRHFSLSFLLAGLILNCKLAITKALLIMGHKMKTVILNSALEEIHKEV